MVIDILKYLKPKKEEEKETEPIDLGIWGNFDPSKWTTPSVSQNKIDLSKYIVLKGEVKAGVGAKAEGGIKLETKKEEPNAFDTLNESIEKNYKQYQNLTKKLESYQAEYDYAPENIKPSLASNFNKLVGQHNDLVKQLQSDIGKRDQMITTTNKINFMKYKQLTGLPGEAGKTTPLPGPKPIDYGYGLREDKSQKGLGYFGELKRLDNPNDISTEISVGVEIDGKETEIPSLVPTLNQGEINYLLSNPLDEKLWRTPIGKQIVQKAVDYAKMRISQGKSPFAQQGEQSTPEMKPLIEGLPISKPEEKPKSILELTGVKKPTTPEGLKMGIETSLGTWEEQKKANPELQKVEDLANFLPKVSDLSNFQNQNMSKEQSEIAYLYSLQTDTPLPITIKDMQSNLKKYGNINPPKESWGEYFKREGLLKTILFGPDTKYGKAEKLREQLKNMNYTTAAESFGWKGFILLTGAQIIDALFQTPVKVKGKVFSDEEVNNLFNRAEKAYQGEGKFSSDLSNNDLAAVKTLTPYIRSAVESGKPMQFPVDLKIPQQVSAFGTQVYAGLTPEAIAKSWIATFEAGNKITADMIQSLDPLKLSQVTELLFNYSPAFAIQLMETRAKFAVPEVEAVEKPEVSLAKPEMTIDEAKKMLIEKGIKEEHLTPEFLEKFIKKPEIQELPPGKKEDLTKGLEPELPEFKEEIEREPTAEELRIIDMERQIPENLKKPVPKELKADYLKIIGKEVKLAKDKMKLAEDIRKDITPSPEILVKYPNLIKELSKPEFTKIEIPKVEIPESLKKPVPPELKDEYLKIIQKEVKPAIDKLKIIKDIKENKPISEGMLGKYPNLVKQLEDVKLPEIKIRKGEELPEGEKPLAPELKQDYLKIIGKDIKYTPDRLELLRDIRQDIPISEGLQTKYPDLMAKLPEVKFAEIEVRKAVMPEEKIEKPMVESKTLATPEQIKQIHTIADKKAMISEKGKVKPQYRALAKAMTGKISSKEMTEKEAEIFIDSLGRLPEPRLNTKTGELIPPSIARTTKLVTQDFFKRRYKEPTPWRYLTPQSYYAEMLGVKPLVEPYEIGKQEFDLEFRKTSKTVDLIIDKLNKINKITAGEKFKSKLRNIPTKAESNMAELVNKYEEAPNSLPQEEKDVFNYFRSLSRDLIDRENKVRESVDLPPIKYKKAYFRHTADSMAKEMLEGKYPFPQGLKYWSEKIVGKKIFNPMEFQRKLSDELIDLWSKDLRAVTKSMLWSGLKEIHLTQPAKFFSEQLNAISKDLPIYKNLSPEEQKAYDQTTVIPASTKKWLIDYINQVIKGQETELDASLNRIVTQSGLKGLFNKVLSPFGRTVGRKPITNLFAFGGRITISGVMGWIPRQIIRNIFQQVQNLALYGVKATLKSYLPASVDKNLEGLLTDSLFLKSYTGFEELPTNLMGKLEKVWLAPYGWTAIWNAKQGMKTAYWDTLDLIKNPKYKDLGWADPQRSEDTPRDYLYPSEKEKLLKEMEFGSGCTQYQYIPIGMPEVFRYKTLIPVTRLQSWWMNYFTKFTREAIYRGLKGETGYGAKLPWSRRVNYLKYVIIGGAILTALGFRKSFMIAVLPTTLSPAGQLAIGIYNYTLVTSDWQRTMALKQIKNSWTAFIPGSLAWKDFIAVWNGEKDLKDLFFYKTTVKEEKKQQAPKGKFPMKVKVPKGSKSIKSKFPMKVKVPKK